MYITQVLADFHPTNQNVTTKKDSANLQPQLHLPHQGKLKNRSNHPAPACINHSAAHINAPLHPQPSADPAPTQSIKNQNVPLPLYHPLRPYDRAAFSSPSRFCGLWCFLFLNVSRQNKNLYLVLQSRYIAIFLLTLLNTWNHVVPASPHQSQKHPLKIIAT